MRPKPTKCSHYGMRNQACRLTWIVLQLTWLLCTAAFSQSAIDAQLCEDFGRYRHVQTTDPGRPNRPLRQENISDEEVSEVQRAALDVYPDSIVSISGVTDGCDCEDGGRCTAQVWLALNRGNQTRSLVLSKIDGHWKIGAIQSWWIQWHAHKATDPGWGYSKQQVAWQQENQRLLNSYPTCPTPPAKWVLVRSAGPLSTCVDPSSLQVSESIRRVNFKTAYPPPQNRTPSFWELKSIINLRAFDCKDHRERIDQTSNYLTDGSVTISPGHKDPVLWDPIWPNTVSAADLDLVCGLSTK
jgi:hypothetical protein